MADLRDQEIIDLGNWLKENGAYTRDSWLAAIWHRYVVAHWQPAGINMWSDVTPQHARSARKYMEAVLDPRLKPIREALQLEGGEDE